MLKLKIAFSFTIPTRLLGGRARTIKKIMSKTLTPEQIADLRSSFRRCSDETVQAILSYRHVQDASQIPTIVRGIIERFLPSESIANFKVSGDETRLSEDLGIDSLTMLEIVVSVEEALDMRMEDSQMRQIRTLGDIKGYLANRVTGQGEETSSGGSRKYNSQAVKLSLPQQFPFLFVDQAEIEGDLVRATYQVKGDEFFLDGHFPKNPIFPASIIFEALGQAGCLWIMECAGERCNGAKPDQVLFASMEGARFFHKVKPGDLVEMEMKLVKLRAPLAVFHGTVKVKGQKVAQVDQLMLAFGDESLMIEHS